MTVLGKTVAHGSVLVSCPGKQKIIFGVDMSAVHAWRVWLDDDLNDYEIICYLKRKVPDTTIDYEILKHHQGRQLVHAFSLSKVNLKNILKKFKPNYISTVLHGLGYGIAKHYDIADQVVQCISVFADGLVHSVHQAGKLYFFKKTTHNLRLLLQYYQLDNEFVDIDRSFLLDFSKEGKSRYLQKAAADLDCEYVDKSICKQIIPYGLACRGCHD